MFKNNLMALAFIASVFLAILTFVSSSLIYSIHTREVRKEGNPPGERHSVALTESSGEIPGTSYIIEKIIEGPDGVLYALSKYQGFLISFDEGGSWEERNRGLPRKVVYPFKEEKLRHLTGVGVDPAKEGRVAVTTPSELYISSNYGLTWEQIPTQNRQSEIEGWPKPYSYFTSVALSPIDPNAVLLGTSFDGFYETRDRGKTWTDPSENARFLIRGANFYEEIAGIAYDPYDPETIFIASGFGKNIYTWNPGSKEQHDLKFPGCANGEIVRSMEFNQSKRDRGWRLQIVTDKNTWFLTWKGRSWKKANYPFLVPHPKYPTTVQKEERIRKAENKSGIYITAFGAHKKNIDRYIRFIKKQGMNALVVDFKDDYGILTYNTKLKLPRSNGVVREKFNAGELIDLAHRSGIYLIARIIVFKDRALYRYNNYAYATWDKKTNWAWAHLFRIQEETQEPQDGQQGTEKSDSLTKGTVSPGPSGGNQQDGNQAAEYADTNNEEPGEGIKESGQTEEAAQTAQKPVRYYQKEHWVDPFAPFIWEYNIAVAKELQDLGVDEIQFDYIRFPTDGDLRSITYRHKRDGMTRMDALESFLAMAREVITIPISTDLYGFNSWHRMGNWNGQSIEMVCDYVDVIAPMFYPSHFPRAFIGGLEYTERAKQIYREGTTRAVSIAAGRSIIRPYIQAFLIGGEVNFSEQLYANYLKRQIEGTLEAPSSGYTLWNAGNNYYMLTFPLQGLLPE